MSLWRVQWQKWHTNRCTHTHTHGLNSIYSHGALGAIADWALLMELLYWPILFYFFPLPLSVTWRKSVQGQAAAWTELVSDFWSDNRWKEHIKSSQTSGSINAALGFRQRRAPTMPPCCVRKGERLSRRLLNFLRGGYQRAEASSISQCDDRFSNESSNESERRWRGAGVKQKKLSSRALDIRKGLMWWHWMIYVNDMPWSRVNNTCFLPHPHLAGKGNKLSWKTN